MKIKIEIETDVSSFTGQGVMAYTNQIKEFAVEIVEKVFDKMKERQEENE